MTLPRDVIFGALQRECSIWYSRLCGLDETALSFGCVERLTVQEPDKNDGLFDQILALDASLASAAGLCRLVDGVITLDSNQRDTNFLRSIVEHELSHRQAITSTHYGNLLALALQASTTYKRFGSDMQKPLTEILEAFIPNGRNLCLEGHATFNQRTFLPESEQDWLRRLRKLKDSVYYSGYCLAYDIMRHFPVPEQLRLHLSDRILLLPLHVDWYSRFSTVTKAYDFITMLSSEEHPSNRMVMLKECLDRMSKTIPNALRNFNEDVRTLGLEEYKNSQRSSIAYDAQVGEGKSIDVHYYPVGTNLFRLFTRLIDTHLKSPLKDMGFVYADPHTVTDINELVKAWNKDSNSEEPAIAEFRTPTRFSSKTCNIYSRPLSGKRRVGASTPDNILQMLNEMKRSKLDQYCIARFWHITEEDGWEVTDDKVLPCGSWYFLLGVLCKQSPGVNGQAVVSLSQSLQDADFLQFYCTFDDADECASLFSSGIPNVIWLLPYPHSPTYSEKLSLQNDAHRLYTLIEASCNPRSDLYCVLVQNAVNYLVDQIDSSCPRSFTHEDYGANWRLWVTHGNVNLAFVTPKISNIDEVLETTLTQNLGAVHVAQKTKSLDCLLSWFSSADGF